MSRYDSLLNTLSQHVGGNVSRLKCLADAVFSITKSRSVNLVKMATDSQMTALQTSRYRRLQRFFAEWKMPQLKIARLILSKIPKPKDGYILSIDRTNWQFGQTEPPQKFRPRDVLNFCMGFMHLGQVGFVV